MALESFGSSSQEKRSWEESEDCPVTGSVPNSSSNGQDGININKRPRIQPETGKTGEHLLCFNIFEIVKLTGFILFLMIKTMNRMKGIIEARKDFRMRQPLFMGNHSR